MKNILYGIIILFIFSCSNSAEEPIITNINNTITVPMHNATSQISIEGMTCEIGCVRTVKSHLSKMEGVLEIEMDFDTSRTTDFSTVQYDNRIVSEAEMITEIESIANGIYTVTEASQQKL